MSDPDDLRRAIESISPVDEREASSITATLDRLTWPEDLFDEDANPHHVTASGFVLSSRGVILHRHRRLGIWVQPGGHVDHGESPARAAARECTEETGLPVRHPDPVELFHVDVHPGPKGHTHYDLRYILLAPPVDPVPPPDESPEVYWFSFEDALERCEPALVAAIEKLGRAAARFNVRE
ncbi:MAG: NUDIX domain-containing protein [Acidobacteria bacterium]|nr:NUDIX domain-containing protein [Acidobacteriota bacterium]